MGYCALKGSTASPRHCHSSFVDTRVNKDTPHSSDQPATAAQADFGERAEAALKKIEDGYRTMIEWLPEAINVHRDGYLIYVNPAAVRMFGATSAQELIGKPILALVHPDYHEATLARARSIIEKGLGSPRAELKYLKLDGTVIDVEVQGIQIVFDGKPSALVAMHDISVRKQADTALRELNLQLGEKSSILETTLDSISQGICMFDADGRLSTFNPRVRDLLALPESLLKGRPTLQEITLFQAQRGDFGSDKNLLDEPTRRYIATVTAGHQGDVPTRYLRTTAQGLILEVNTQKLPDGGMVRTFTDVTSYIQAEAARERSDALLQATQAIARVGCAESDFVTGTVFWTEGVYRIFDTSPEEFTPTTRNIGRFLPPQSKDELKAFFAEVSDEPRTHSQEQEMLTFKGQRIWVFTSGTTIWENGRVVKRVSVMQDITERIQAQAALRESEDRYRTIIEWSPEPITVHRNGLIIFANNASARVFGAKSAQDMIGMIIRDRLHPDYHAFVAARLKDVAELGTTAPLVEEKYFKLDGTPIDLEVQTTRIVYNGMPANLSVMRDITDRKKSEALIRQQAFFDALTGLPNRRMLRDRLEQEIKKSRRDEQQLGILFIDLDHFKEVNDTLGHDSGDLLLIEAARRIQGCVRESDTVARMGGDEFTVVLTDLSEPNCMERILQEILFSLASVFQLGNEQVFVSASIGITVYPTDAQEVEDLFKNADQALYVAKGAGRNRFSFFTPALQEAAQTRLRLANDLRTGLADQQFRVVYQPIVELASGRIHKAEALIRWQHPTRGLVSPASFIPIAETSGLIVDIGEWVFQQATRQVREWRTSLDPKFQISINKSPVQFHHEGREKQSWIRQLETMGLPGEAIVVEITEGLLLNTSSSVTEQLLELSDAGIQVSLDDFGTGYSSLSYLQKFDIDFIKIDQSFVRHLIPASTDLALCKAIIVMAHELGMKVIAEGVETAEQRALLTAAGCDYGQGYLFARPMPAQDFEAFVKNIF